MRTWSNCLARAEGQFDHVVFAVLDRQPGTPARAAFGRAACGSGEW